MTYCQDLTPCTYGHYLGLRPVVAVGWLETPFDFPRGPVKRAMRRRLQALFSDISRLNHAMGSHACRFCAQAAGIDPARADGRRDLPGGSATLLIPGRDVVYAVPSLILHYIDAHQYCPPSAFHRAVRVCPPPGSRRYYLALLAAGGDMPRFVGKAAEWDPRRHGVSPGVARQLGVATSAIRHAMLLWRIPLARALYRRVRSRATGPRVLPELLSEEWAATWGVPTVLEFPRQRVVDFLLRVSKAGHAVHEQGDEFVLPHPDGEIRVCPIDKHWVVRLKKGNVWHPYGAAWNEAELERFLTAARRSPIL